ncbi:MAG: hypothetical protein KAV82_00325 [Phycisphaerae bacterium]|nr:hypothetical protein [Phycisphaerae bacterium]
MPNTCPRQMPLNMLRQPRLDTISDNVQAEHLSSANLYLSARAPFSHAD